jgi:hypothetical protein
MGASTTKVICAFEPNFSSGMTGQYYVYQNKKSVL